MSQYLTIDWFWVLMPIVVACGIVVASIILMRGSGCLPSKLLFTGSIIAATGMIINKVYLVRFDLNIGNDWSIDPAVQNIFMMSALGDILGRTIFVFGLIMFALAYRNPQSIPKNLS